MKRALFALALLLSGARVALGTDPQTEAVPPLWNSGEFKYDGAGNIRSIGTVSNPNGDGRTNNYVYDEAGRLRSAGANYNTLNSETYEYDAFGNLTKITTTTSAGPVSTTFTIDSSTNRVSSATYDLAGNMTADGLGQTFTYDPLGSVTQKAIDTLTEQYINTADGERIALRYPSSDEWKWTLRGFDNKVLREYKSSGLTGSLTWTEDYVYRGSLLAAAVRPPAQGGVRHFHLDHLGTPRLITDANRYAFAYHDYFPFGAEVTSFRQEMLNRGLDRPEPMKFTGHERDFANTTVENKTYVDYMHARYYLVGWGRFLSVDPVLPIDAISSPQLWNRFSYVRNNPLSAFDPTGKTLKFTTDDLANYARISAVANRKLHGHQLVIGSNGVASLRRTHAQGPESSEQKHFRMALERVIGDKATTSIEVRNETSLAIAGDFDQGMIDIGDIEAFGNDEPMSAATVLGHEIMEQYAHDVRDQSKYNKAHSYAVFHENLFSGWTRGGSAYGPKTGGERYVDIFHSRGGRTVDVRMYYFGTPVLDITRVTRSEVKP